jgi:AcrR family transcriptional regulator
MTDASVRAPKQKRSLESFERVLEASTSLLEERPFDAFTIQDVSRRAGVSVGAIYERFGNKDSLLRAVHARAMESLEAEQVDVAAGDGSTDAPAHEIVAASVRSMAGVFERHEKLLRAFMHLGAVDNEINRRRRSSTTDLSRRFAAAVLARRDEIAHANPEAAVDVAFRVAFSTFARRTLHGPEFESDRPIRWKELADEVAAACVAYLVGPVPAGKRRSS